MADSLLNQHFSYYSKLCIRQTTCFSLHIRHLDIYSDPFRTGHQHCIILGHGRFQAFLQSIARSTNHTFSATCSSRQLIHSLNFPTVFETSKCPSVTPSWTSCKLIRVCSDESQFVLYLLFRMVSLFLSIKFL